MFQRLIGWLRGIFRQPREQEDPLLVTEPIEVAMVRARAMATISSPKAARKRLRELR